jgi:hypothetical protein
MKVQPMYLDTEVDEVYVQHKCDKGDRFFVKMIKPKNTNHLLYVSGNSLVCPVCQSTANRASHEAVQI